MFYLRFYLSRELQVNCEGLTIQHGSYFKFAVNKESTVEGGLVIDFLLLEQQ